jgi:hypothetical protein
MKSSKKVSLLACLSLFTALQAGAQFTSPIGVEFLGRDQFNSSGSTTADPACIGLNPPDLAGALPQIGWTGIDNHYNVANFNIATFVSAENGTTVPLLDTNFAPTGVTLTYTASDSWDNNVNYADISTAPNAILMQGTIKQANGNHVPITFTFNNVPQGQYDVYVYCDVDANGAVASLWDLYSTKTNYILEQQQFYATNTFIQSTATTAAEATNVANYVKFSLGTDARGQIGILGQYVSSPVGMGVAAIQLVPTGPLQPNTVPLSLLLEPISRRGADGTNDVTFTANVRGPAYYAQWLQNGTPIPGETNFSYTPNPISAATMQGAKISFTASNNLNSVTTSNAILTVGNLLYVTNGVTVLDGGIVNIATQPTNVTKLAGRGGGAAFTVGATSGYIGDASGAAPPIYYQWQSAPQGSSTFTNIPGATKPTLHTSTYQIADNGTQYRAAVNASDATVNSAIAVVTVLPNTNPPVATAGALTRNDGTNDTVIEVGVSFDEVVDPATLVVGNFGLSSGSITSLKVATNSYITYSSAILRTTGLTPGSTYTLSANGVVDTSGNVLHTNVSFTVPTQIHWAEIGVPPNPGQVVPVGSNGFDVLNGGRAEWTTYDEVDMAYVVKTNDFDVKVQVVFIEPASEWTRCGLAARNYLDIGFKSDDNGMSSGSTNHLCSAYVQTHVNGTQDLQDTGLWPPNDPNQPVNGGSNNSHEQNTRLANGAATSGWQTSNAGPPDFPDHVWLRLQRIGTNFMGYASGDGINWTNQGSAQLADETNVMYVGVSLGVETGNIWNGGSNPFNVWTSPFDSTYDRLFVAQFRNFGDNVAVVQPTITISRSGTGVTITYTGTLLQSPTVGSGASWTAVPGATSPYPVPTTAASMFFRSSQ